MPCTDFPGHTRLRSDFCQLRGNEKPQRVWALTECDQMAHGRRKTKDGAIIGIVEWEKNRGTLFCTTVMHSREGVVVPEKSTVST